MGDWKEMMFDKFVNINPQESLSKLSESKKIAMEMLQPFTKRITGYSIEPYNGGMKFRNGDTIVARITPCLENGKTAFVDILDENEVGFGSTEFIVLREKTGVSDKHFLYYFSISEEFRDIAILAMTGSSGRQRVEINALRNRSFIFPALSEQKAIAGVLSSLDDKIDLLHRQNKTLEAIAETLFRQWFVEEAQDDWEEVKIDDVVSIKGGTTPSTTISEYWDGDLYWSTPKDLSNHNSVYLLNTERKITEKGLAQIGSGLLPTGSVLLSSRAPIGYLAITNIPVAINQGYIGIVCDKCISNYIIYLWCKANMELIENSGNGSVFQEIAKSTFKSITITIPSQKTSDEFDKIIEPQFEKIRTNQLQINTLERLRDTLLPKLMSGEAIII